MFDRFLPTSVLVEADVDTLRRHRVLVGASMAGASVAAIFLVQRLLLEPAGGSRIWVMAASIAAFAVTPVALKRTGAFRAAAVALLAALLVMMGADGYFYGGIGAPSFIAMTALPLMATFLLGARSGYVAAGLAALVVIGFLGLALAGFPFPDGPPPDLSRAMHALSVVGLLGFVALLAHIYEDQRQVSARRLAESEHRYEAAFNAANDGLFEWQPTRRRLYVSPLLARFLGVEGDAGIGDLDRLRDHVHPADRRGFDAGMREAGEGEGRGSAEFRLRHFSGEYRWIDCRLQAESNKEGEISAIYGTLRDISERRRFEQLKDDFVAGVSHELRTPLTSIRGALSLLDVGIVGQLPEKVQTMIGIAHSNSERLLILVNDLLDLQKIEVGRMEVDAEEVDIEASIEAAIESNRELAARCGVAVRSVRLAPGPRRARADRFRLEQVLGNLVSNAAKFSAPGGVVELRAAEVGASLRIEVEDHGCGIPAQFQDRVFRRFSQAMLRGDKPSGSGLGLTLSKALVERMGGTIGFESTEGQGSTFWIELPRSPPP